MSLAPVPVVRCEAITPVTGKERRMRRGAKPAKSKVAKLTVARKSPKSDGARVRDPEKRLTEALEQQTATSEILRVISSSRTDAQPVFDAIVRSTARLCDATSTWVYRVENELIHFVACHNAAPDVRERVTEYFQQAFPQTLDRSNGVVARAIVDGAIVHVPDFDADPELPEMTRRAAKDLGYRSGLAVPMFRDGVPIGAIGATRDETGPFSNSQIELLKTFADQAVIAIENVRLFNETKAALERQTATAEILRVISESQTDVQPVFDAIARNAVTLCGGIRALVLRFEGGMLHVAGHHNIDPHGVERIRRAFPHRPGRDTPVGRAFLDRSIVHVPDLQAAASEFAASTARQRGVGSMLAVPLLREQEGVGVIGLAREVVGPFSPEQIEVLETFADQAVIAVENVRLFTELQASNRDLTTALDKQTATSDILRVISQSQTDVQPVFDAILASAVHLLRGHSGALTRVARDQIELAALTSTDEAAEAAWRARFPRPRHAPGMHATAMRDRAPLNIADSETDARVSEAARAVTRLQGFRSWAVVPLLRHDEGIGTIGVSRHEPGGFTDDEIALLQTFADQAVIAIENVRLFTELQEKNRALTDAHAQVSEALEQQTATAEVLRVISGSPTDLQPVFDSMLQSAVRLLSGFGGAILLYDGSALHLGAVTGGRPQSGAEDWFRSIYPLPLDPETPIGIAILERRMIQLPDTEESPSQITREVARGFQFRALVTVPMLREGSAIGTISITRAAPGEFSERQVEVLQTFADQAVIAIENVRLFKELEASNREIADKSRQLEVASQHKSEFLANMSHELRTPLNAIIGFSEVLSERMFGELNEKQEEYLKDINASGTHLLSLINDILDLSKIEAGRMELELSDFDLPTALDSALTLVRERAARRGITLEQSVDERLGQMRADERKVRQVVLNLLSNAIKFTPEGGRIDVRAVPVDESVEVSVSDTGVGIAPEDQEKVFEEFRQVGTAEKKAEGTGLGLTLCRKFIELQGGRVWVKSQVGVGSTFTFTIPVHQDE